MIATQYDTKIATLTDAEMLAALSAKTFYDTFSKSNTADNIRIYVEKAFSGDQIRRELQDPACTFVLAFDNSTPIGYAKLRLGDVPEELQIKNAIEIERIYAVQAYLDKKVGMTLMQTCLGIAKEKKYSTVWLGVWEHNPKAIQFYERWGFEKFGWHNFLLGEDLQTDLLMNLSLHD